MTYTSFSKDSRKEAVCIEDENGVRAFFLFLVFFIDAKRRRGDGGRICSVKIEKIDQAMFLDCTATCL